MAIPNLIKDTIYVNIYVNIKEVCLLKVTFIGTSAGEGYPGVWCECINCRKARQWGGRNIRGNSCSMIDDDFLIDCSAHFAAMAPHLGISPSKIKGLLVTHAHMDHFAPEFLWKRFMSRELRGLSDEEKTKYISPNFTELPTLHVFGNEFVRQKMFAEDNLLEKLDVNMLDFHLIVEGVAQTLDDLTFTPVRAQHTNIRGFAHSYIIERGGKTLLHASDTGGYDDDMMALILSKKYDCVVMEGTVGLNPTRFSGHMGLNKNKEFRDLLIEKGCIAADTPFILTHLCPHWTPPHDIFAPMAAEEGFTVAYDGMEFEF